MILPEGIVQSFEVIRGNKARSILTMLGINFGVGSLIAIAIIGLAFRNSINTEMGRYGTTLLWVSLNGSAYARDERRTFLDEKDIQYFKNALNGITGSETLSMGTEPVSYMEKRKDVSIMKVDASHFDIFSIGIKKGRLIVRQDVDLKRNVCVLSSNIADHQGSPGYIL